MNQDETPDWTTGYVQVYTGDGKGKTTAAFGLALRAVGAGLKVFIGQFMKGRPYSELRAIQAISEQVELRQFGRECFIRGRPDPEDIDAAREGLEVIRDVLRAGRHRLVILDEANVAAHVGLFSVDDLMAVIADKPAAVELVITGRRAHPRVLERADLVTDMRCLKHYYDRGIGARKGIEN